MVYIYIAVDYAILYNIILYHIIYHMFSCQNIWFSCPDLKNARKLFTHLQAPVDAWILWGPFPFMVWGWESVISND